MKQSLPERPFFMPDATRASVRGISSEQLRAAGTEALVVNTYHLMLSPGSDRIARAGGVHAFMRWQGLVLSDSGGYQVYSLIHKHPDKGRVTEDGAEFKSPIDGSKHLLTPEKSIQIQFDLGVDMMVVLDDPRPNEAPEEEIDTAVERSVRWAKRCREEYDRQVLRRKMTEETRPLLFGVVQGGIHRSLRKKCVDGLAMFDFDGYGFGARHVDGQGVFLEDIVRYTAEIIPQEKLKFALGVGTLDDIVRCHAYGWEMFDCVIPTREGRHGRVFFKQEGDALRRKTMTITNAQYREDRSVIDATCGCPACSAGYSRAYLHHLFRMGEPLGAQLATLHNLFVYNSLMRTLQK